MKQIKNRTLMFKNNEQDLYIHFSNQFFENKKHFHELIRQLILIWGSIISGTLVIINHNNILLSDKYCIIFFAIIITTLILNIYSFQIVELQRDNKMILKKLFLMQPTTKNLFYFFAHDYYNPLSNLLLKIINLVGIGIIMEFGITLYHANINQKISFLIYFPMVLTLSMLLWSVLIQLVTIYSNIKKEKKQNVV